MKCCANILVFLARLHDFFWIWMDSKIESNYKMNRLQNIVHYIFQSIENIMDNFFWIQLKSLKIIGNRDYIKTLNRPSPIVHSILNLPASCEGRSDGATWFLSCGQPFHVHRQQNIFPYVFNLLCESGNSKKIFIWGKNFWENFFCPYFFYQKNLVLWIVWFTK